MKDAECTKFLQWALPRMRMRWSGFRKVRRQVCRRIARRIDELGLTGLQMYIRRLESDPLEWEVLSSLCRVTISRFYRDRGVFDRIGDEILPRLARRSEGTVRCWSAGCASGEEVYTLKILWELGVAPEAGDAALYVIGTDSDQVMLDRAIRGVYRESSVREMPAEMVRRAFERSGDALVIRPRFREGVTFESRDIREPAPGGSFDMILCRNLVFTYFDEPLQREILFRFSEGLSRGGLLVVGSHESLPRVRFGLKQESPSIYVRA